MGKMKDSLNDVDYEELFQSRKQSIERVFPEALAALKGVSSLASAVELEMLSAGDSVTLEVTLCWAEGACRDLRCMLDEEVSIRRRREVAPAPVRCEACPPGMGCNRIRESQATAPQTSNVAASPVEATLQRKTFEISKALAGPDQSPEAARHHQDPGGLDHETK